MDYPVRNSCILEVTNHFSAVEIRKSVQEVIDLVEICSGNVIERLDLVCVDRSVKKVTRDVLGLHRIGLRRM